MSAHDLSRLSSLDFEELTHDLLEAAWNVRLENFKTGRDGGIDLRCIGVDGGKTVVQCKHYLASGFSKLVHHLRKEERPKVDRMAPERYVLVTSVELTPDNKADIIEALGPHIRTPDDIYGGNEIEALLRNHPKVEQTHYKLWLTSTAVLERVMHNAVWAQSDFRVERIRRKQQLFVQNSAYPRAMRLLDEGRVVVISGPPGIGKTTLAEMLIYSHLADGFELVEMQADIQEGKSLFRADRKQLFYFDDFLGQTYFGDRHEFLGKNQDMAISDFIDMIRSTNKSRFILTTREHILSGAIHSSERLRQSGIYADRCLLQLSDYRKSQKARILFNHLYFSELSDDYKAAMLLDDFFLRVVKHENFSPRVIEWLSSFRRVKSVPPENYQHYVLQLLDNPEQIWRQAFEGQISQAARDLLIAEYTMGYDVLPMELELAFSALHAHGAKRYNFSIAPTDFRNALKELEGSFLSTNRGRVSFTNPSIRDFLASVLTDSRERIEDVISSAVRFRQVAGLWELAREARYPALREHLLAVSAHFFGSLSRLLSGPELRWAQDSGRRVGTYIDYSIEARAKFAIGLAEELKVPEAYTLAKIAVHNALDHWEQSWFDIDSAISLLADLKGAEWFLKQGGGELADSISEEVIGCLDEARADNWLSIFRAEGQTALWTDAQKAVVDTAFAQYHEDGVNDERFSCEEDEFENLKDSLERLQEKSGFDFSTDIAMLEEKIAERVQMLGYDDDPPRSWSGVDNRVDFESDEVVREVFRAPL